MPNQEAPRFSRRTFLRGSVVAGAAAFVASCTNEPLPSWATYTRPPNAPTSLAWPSASAQASVLGELDPFLEAFKIEMGNFTLEKSLDQAYEMEFIERAAKTYLKLSGSGIIDAGSFDVKGLTDRDKFDAEALKSGHNPGSIQAMFVNARAKTIFIDKARLAEDSSGLGIDFGTAFIDTLWDGLLILDATTNAMGDFLDNPKYTLQDGSTWSAYFGGLALAQDSIGFIRYNISLRQAVMVRLAEQLDRGKTHFINFPFAALGTSVLVPLSRKARLSAKEFHRLYSRSMWEEAAEKFGSLLSGEMTAKEKGYELFMAIDANDRASLEGFGVFKLIDS